MTHPRSEVPSDDGLSLAYALRDEWLGHGLSTSPADRARAEGAVTELYGLIGAPVPRFVWVASPAAALPVLRDARHGYRPSRLRAATAPAHGADWPVAARLASSVSDLRRRMDARIGWSPVSRGRYSADQVSPEYALATGAPLRSVLRAAVHDPLRVSLRDGLRLPLRTAMLPVTDDSLGLAWYGQHDAHWIAHYDAHARLGMVTYPREDAHRLGLWAELARSAGWWWPSEEVCVMAERPVEAHTEPLPVARPGELRPHRGDGPAVRFPDGAKLYVLHGTPVPEWVVTDPDVERIHQEPNVEVRRCAIERIGWDTYIERAGLDLVATAPDPGNPGSDLRLYHVPRHVWGRPSRVLLVVNGSVEPDGRRRRYGLSVPAHLSDPVSAAGWSYGLTGEQYAGLVRRT